MSFGRIFRVVYFCLSSLGFILKIDFKGFIFGSNMIRYVFCKIILGVRRG